MRKLTKNECFGLKVGDLLSDLETGYDFKLVEQIYTPATLNHFEYYTYIFYIETQDKHYKCELFRDDYAGFNSFDDYYEWNDFSTEFVRVELKERIIQEWVEV